MNWREEIRVQGFPIPTIKFIKAGNNSIGHCDGERTEATKNMLCSGKPMSVDGDEKNQLGIVEVSHM